MHDIQTTIKLTKEYASNLNCLLIDFNKTEFLYSDFFNRNFNDCIMASTDDLLKDRTILDTKYINIIIVNINDGCLCDNYDDLKKQLEFFRRKNDIVPMYAINSAKDDKINEIIKGSYILDGIIPKPFYKYGLYRLMYRVLKRITHLKYIEAYVVSLEEELAINIPNELEIPKIVTGSSCKLENSNNSMREKDVRFTQNHKISAIDFMESLDDTIIDKIELLSEKLDDFMVVLYDFENASAQDAYILIPSIHDVINEVFIIVDSLGSFGVTARAFGSLSEFLHQLSLDNLKNLDKKNMLAIMLIAVVNDLEKWLKVIFVEHSTDDIHYFDASFSSNILEIENIFVEVNEDEEDDLEFF